jgi:hypothetical protein
MSRKTIAIQIPQKAQAAPAADVKGAEKPPAAEQWISQSETPAVSGAAGFTIVLPAEPDVFDLVRIGLLLPYATAWLWTFGAARKGFRLFAL